MKSDGDGYLRPTQPANCCDFDKIGTPFNSGSFFTCNYCGLHSTEPLTTLNHTCRPLVRHCPGSMHSISSEELEELTGPFDRSLLDVDHPKHYSRWKMEPIEFIAINDLPWWLANVIKYTMRFDAKDGLKDLYKARSYLDMKIRQQEGETKFWEKPVSEERKLNRV